MKLNKRINKEKPCEHSVKKLKKQNEKQVQNIKNCHHSNHSRIPVEFLFEEIQRTDDYGQ